MSDTHNPLKAGVARATITPPIGVPLVGFAGRGPSTGVHDDLFATALVLEDRDIRIAIVSCDLLYLSASLVAGIRQEITGRTQIPPSHIMISCTHTHYGPATHDPEEPDCNGRPDVAHYVSCLKYHIAGAVQGAMACLQPVQAGIGHGQSDIGINRRARRPDGTIVLGHNPEGVIDRELGVLRFDTPEGQPLAALIHFACHPVAQGWNTREISADIPGQMRQVFEAMTRASCLYLQGGCGNINPKEMEIAWEPARRQGTILGCDAVKVFENTRPRAWEGIAAASMTASLPRLSFSSLAEGERKVTALREELARLRARGLGDDDSAVWWAQHRLKRAQEMYESLTNGIFLPPVPAELQAIRIGEAALVSSPGEPFAEIGLEIKARSPFSHTFFVGYTNGSIGYIPWPSAYKEGGYEVESACQLGPESASMVVEGCLELLQRLHEG